ncbi:hypothetical protein ANCDUO_20467, partial [Ancylostoma duodenale]
ANGERNYHIFYQLIAGAPADLYKRLRLAPPDKFKYLKYGTTTFFARPGSKSTIAPDRLSEQAKKVGMLTDAIVDDAADFSHLSDALGRAGLSPDERFPGHDNGGDKIASLKIYPNFTREYCRSAELQIFDIWRVVAGVLHLGNIDFVDSVDDSR